MVTKSKLKSQAFLATLVNIKGILRNDPNCNENISKSFQEIIIQSRSLFYNSKHNKHIDIGINDIEGIPYQKPRECGRPVQRRLMSNRDKQQKSAMKNESKHRTCAFCHSVSHRITTCDERKRWGQKISDIHIDKFCAELCNTTSSLYPTHQLPWKKRKVTIIDGVPKATEFLSVSKKYFRDRHVINENEDNLCVLVNCLGKGGIQLEGYSPCYITVGKVRTWITSHNYKKIVFFFSGDNITKTILSSPSKLV